MASGILTFDFRNGLSLPLNSGQAFRNIDIALPIAKHSVYEAFRSISLAKYMTAGSWLLCLTIDVIRLP